ncbi:SWIM zinc finger family protein [Saccharopolyspora shandongensis]|uniref:SWIM zinc finger family protein n=1 Tax=Saccharopolyspora shandongensis TaxID=418495 RepID=UPI003431F42F
MPGYDDYDEFLIAFDDEDEEDAADEVDPHRRAVTFPAFPPGKRYGKKFADTWWGNAWIEAMEDTALDPEQLKKGRKYAFAGQVGAITVSPGRISAPVHDGDHYRPHTTVIGFRELSDAGWNRFLDKVAGNAGHIAALLDRDMPRELVRAADDADVRLLPSYGDLDPDCGCPGWDSPCRHAAALAYQVSWLLDRDPFVLLLVRGRGEDELTEELHRRNARRAVDASAAASAAGTPAAEAWSAQPSALPDPPGPVSAVPLDLAALLADVDVEEPPVAAAAIVVLAADAADRARSLLAGVSVGEPDQWADAVRLAARADRDDLTERAGRAAARPVDFARAVHAWKLAGKTGLTALEDAWTPPREASARAQAEIDEAWRDVGLGESPEVRVWRNRWTLGDRGVQLRLGQDGLWYPFRADGKAWTLSGPPVQDVAEALAELLDGARGEV